VTFLTPCSGPACERAETPVNGERLDVRLVDGSSGRFLAELARPLVPVDEEFEETEP
jgi:hypothetical protein